jgi:hypothetical protein
MLYATADIQANAPPTPVVARGQSEPFKWHGEHFQQNKSSCTILGRIRLQFHERVKNNQLYKATADSPSDKEHGTLPNNSSNTHSFKAGQLPPTQVGQNITEQRHNSCRQAAQQGAH